MERILVIAAHPDDEVLGVGGTISKLSNQGHEIYTHIITDGSSTQYKGDLEKQEKKKREAEAANKILGIKKVFFGELPDMKLDTIPHIKINQEIEKIINKINPEVVFTHHYGDVNKDHKLIFESTLVACRPTPNKNVKKLYTYETLSSTEWGNSNSNDIFIPNMYVQLEEKNIEQKCSAMQEYKTELRDYPHPRSVEAILNNSKQRGNEIGYYYAESFRLIRGIDFD